MKQIETERLILRPFTEADYDDLFEFLYQLRDDEYEGYPGITYENGREHLRYRLNAEAFFAIQLKETGKVIGSISCCGRDFEAKEVGYIVNAGYQRKGYAAEALSAVIRHAFSAGVHRICAECDPENERSWRLLEKVGLAREAHFRQNLYFHKDSAGHPIWKDTCVYAALNDRKGDIRG